MRRVRRRLVAMRLAESVGCGVLAGCVAALMLVPVQLWRGGATLPIAIAMMALGAAGGCMCTFRRWPSLLDAAREADRQLDPTDLLATAWSVRDQADPWVRSVIAIADERCRTLSPSTLVLNRLGARSWGGIGLAVALVLALSLMGSDPPILVARQATVSADVSDDSVRQRQTSPAGERGQPKQTGDQPSYAKTSDASADATPLDSTNESSGDPSAANSSPASGDGEGSTTARQTAPHQRAHDRPGPLGEELLDEEPAGGGDGHSSAVNASGPDAARGSGAAAGSGELDNQSSFDVGWRDAREQAKAELRDGRVPDAYRELVRDYFAE